MAPQILKRKNPSKSWQLFSNSIRQSVALFLGNFIPNPWHWYHFFCQGSAGLNIISSIPSTKLVTKSPSTTEIMRPSPIGAADPPPGFLTYCRTRLGDWDKWGEAWEGQLLQVFNQIFLLKRHFLSRLEILEVTQLCVPLSCQISFRIFLFSKLIYRLFTNISHI